MMKILLAFSVTAEILIFLLMLYCLSGISILLPGMGLIISGGFIAAGLLVVEIALIAVTVLIYRQMRRDSDRLN